MLLLACRERGCAQRRPDARAPHSAEKGTEQDLPFPALGIDAPHPPVAGITQVTRRQSKAILTRLRKQHDAQAAHQHRTHEPERIAIQSYEVAEDRHPASRRA